MADIKSKAKRFLILFVQSEEGKYPVEFMQTAAENHDEAYHQAEIANGWGEYLVLDKKQARKVYKKLEKVLKIW